MARKIPANEWVWCGLPGHFVGGRDCRLHLSTRVGDLRVSTVGDYHPPGHTEDGPKEIGWGRLYETMVFPVDGHGLHGEGGIAGDELICEAYNAPEDAEAGHMRLCREAAAGRLVGEA